MPPPGSSIHKGGLALGCNAQAELIWSVGRTVHCVSARERRGKGLSRLLESRKDSFSIKAATAQDCVFGLMVSKQNPPDLLPERFLLCG
jgi:hypothetical protein